MADMVAIINRRKSDGGTRTYNFSTMRRRIHGSTGRLNAKPLHEKIIPSASKEEISEMLKRLPRVAGFLERLGYLQGSIKRGYREESLFKTHEMFVRTKDLLAKVGKRKLVRIARISAVYFERWNAFTSIMKFCAEKCKTADIMEIERISYFLVHTFSSEADKHLCALLGSRIVLEKIGRRGMGKMADRVQECCEIIMHNKKALQDYVMPKPNEFRADVLYKLS